MGDESIIGGSNVIIEENTKNMMQELADKLCLVYGERMKAVILYGSVARGTQTEESDIDILVLVDGDKTELHRYDDGLCEVSTDMALKYFKVFSIIDVSYQEFVDWEKISPFYKNVSNEGVVLYAA